MPARRYETDADGDDSRPVEVVLPRARSIVRLHINEWLITH
jgi:hypothetical protein